MAKREELDETQKLICIGKAKYGLKFIRVAASKDSPYLVLEHRGHLNRRMADAYDVTDGSIDREYEEYFGKYLTAKDTKKRAIQKLLENRAMRK